METKEQVINYTVMVPVTETRERTVNYSVTKPVNYTKTVTVRGGSWQTVEEEVAGPMVRRTIREPGTWTFDASTCRNVYCRGEVRTECVQCPPKKVCKKIWVPTCEEKTIDCVKYETECLTKVVPYTVTKCVPECRSKTVTYNVCKLVPECRQKTVTYTTCKNNTF
jgi:hypothetical protein